LLIYTIKFLIISLPLFTDIYRIQPLPIR